MDTPPGARTRTESARNVATTRARIGSGLAARLEEVTGVVFWSTPPQGVSLG
jgi:hypothetical protein